MAGSYRHIADKNNKFQGIDLIDNLGDAHEALEECFLMIQNLTKGNKSKIYEAWFQGYARKEIPKENLKECSFKDFWED